MLFFALTTSDVALCDVQIANPLEYAAMMRVDTVANTATWLHAATAPIRRSTGSIRLLRRGMWAGSQWSPSVSASISLEV